MRAFLLILCLVWIAPAALAGDGDVVGGGGPSLLHRIVLYAPNRVLDVLDLVRLRARVGLGTALSVRATEAADLFIGSYAAVYAGLPGPRVRRIPRLPAGLEIRSGVEVSAADLSTGLGAGPDYSATEFGLGFQAYLVGLDIGVDPMEAVDLALGLFLLDLRDDDL
jgi:hypothetical protein